MATKISDDQITVTLASGKDLTLKAINLILLERFDKAHVAPVPPMREAEVIGDETELVPDEEDEGYLEELAAFNQKSMLDLLNLLVLYGCVVELPEDTNWTVTLSFIGVEVDLSNPIQSKIDYVQLHLMGDLLKDLGTMMSNIFALSGVEDEVIQSWMTMFQR